MTEKKYYKIQRIADNKYVEAIYRNNTGFDSDEGDSIEFESLEDAKCFLKYVRKTTAKSEKYRIIANVTTTYCDFSDDETETIFQ